jgi:hypothetical protein
MQHCVVSEAFATTYIHRSEGEHELEASHLGIQSAWGDFRRIKIRHVSPAERRSKITDRTGTLTFPPQAMC